MVSQFLKLFASFKRFLIDVNWSPEINESEKGLDLIIFLETGRLFRHLGRFRAL